MTDFLETHYKTIVDGFARGQVVPFLGAGVNRCGRRDGVEWRCEEHKYLPDGGELAEHLANDCDYPYEEKKLPRVSQYVAVMRGRGRLKEGLRGVFDADYTPTAVHRLLANLPTMLKEKGYPRTEDKLHRQLLVVTTNYDDVLERTFQAVSAPYHLVTYCSGAREFCHATPDDDVAPIKDARTYRGLDDETPVILKIHGAIDRSDRSRDTYVITEDDYIDYLACVDIRDLLPTSLVARLQNSYVLFLGYGLQDWNVRVILRHLWRDPGQRWNSWAIQLSPDELDKRIWARQDVTILDVSLEDYIAEIEKRLRGVTGAGGNRAG